MRELAGVGKLLLAATAVTLGFGLVSAAIGWAISPVANCAPSPPAGVAAIVLAAISAVLALVTGVIAIVTAIARRRDRRLLNASIMTIALVPVTLWLDVAGLLFNSSWCWSF